MGVLTYILGRSGTGKSYSLRNFKPDEIGVVNVQGKILPFNGSGAFDIVNTDDSSSIVKTVERMSKKYKSIVVDDFQYVMGNEFMRRATERGYDKFTEIARHAWDIADCVKNLPGDVIVYVLCHTDTDPDGFEKLKTIGKLLDEKIVLEGMSTIVLKTAVSDGQYMFLTQNNGHDTVKSPFGMFPTYAINNDLKYVDEKIRSYYELGGYSLTESEEKELDDAAAKKDIVKEEGKKKRGSKAKKERIKDTSKKEEKEGTEKEGTESISSEVNLDIPEDVDEELPFPMNDPEEAELEPPKRKSRRKKAETTTTDTTTEQEPEEEPVEAPKRRRRRKTT